MEIYNLNLFRCKYKIDKVIKTEHLSIGTEQSVTDRLINELSNLCNKYDKEGTCDVISLGLNMNSTFTCTSKNTGSINFIIT